MVIVAVTAIIVMLNWEYRKELWFLVSMCLMFSIQYVFVFLLKWPDPLHPGILLLAPVTIYFLAYSGIIFVIRTLFVRLRRDR